MHGPHNILTVSTDASFNASKSVAGFAYWIIADITGQTRRSGLMGSFAGPANDINVAELVAIRAALEQVDLTRLYTKVDKIIVCSDSIKGLSALRHRNSKLPALKLLVEEIHEIIAHWPVKPTYKYVKAHTQRQDPMSLANSWCDRESRARMRERVKLQTAAASE